MKYLICVLIWWCSIETIAAQHYSFNRYADVDGITRVYISNTLLKAIIKNTKTEMKISGNKVRLNDKKLLEKMEGILVLAGAGEEIAEMAREDVTKLSRAKGYKQLLFRNDKKIAIDVFTRQSKGVIEEILFFDKTEKNILIIQLMGRFDPEDLQLMMGS